MPRTRAVGAGDRLRAGSWFGAGAEPAGGPVRGPDRSEDDRADPIREGANDGMIAGTDIQSLRLHKRYDEGDGPLIVLLHGINADAREWRPVIDSIGPGYRCLAFDLLGFGESPQPLDIDYSADEHVIVFENTVRDLGLKEPFVLVGYSLGGDIAVRYASIYPHRLRRLFLLSTPFYLPPERYTARGFSGQVIQAMLMRWAWAFLARGKRDSTAFYEIATGRLKNVTRQFMRTNGDLSTRWEIMSKNLSNCISKATFVDDLPRLTTPTTFVLGIRDPIVRWVQALALRRMKPDLEIRRITGPAADHMLLHAMPKRVGREIVRDEAGRLNVRWRAGAGEPLAILVGPEGAGVWWPVAQPLARRFDVALIELLGFGKSPAPLAAHYDLADHVAAVRTTARALWPAGVGVHVMGFGLGATVGLGYAAYSQEPVASVTAFSPACLAPGLTPQETVRSRHAASALAAYEEVAAMARDERARGLVGEALERRIVPFFRSIQATALAADPAALIARATGRVRLVLPTGDVDAPREWARTVAAEGRIALSEPDGARDLAFTHPARAVAELDPALSPRAGTLAAGMRRAPVREIPLDMVRSVDRRFVMRGAASLLVGVLLLSPMVLPAVWVARGFAAWVAWSAGLAILAAFGVRREGSVGWVVWAVSGGLGAALAISMLLDQRRAVSVFGVFILMWLLWCAFAGLFVAWRVPATPTPRWTLWLQGALALGAAIVAIVSPPAGGRLLRLVLGSYLVGSGLMVARYGIQSWRRASRRTRELLAASRRWTAQPRIS